METSLFHGIIMKIVIVSYIIVIVKNLERNLLIMNMEKIFPMQSFLHLHYLQTILINLLQHGLQEIGIQI